MNLFFVLILPEPFLRHLFIISYLDIHADPPYPAKRRVYVLPLMSYQDPNLMRSYIHVFLESSKNLLTIHADDMKLIVDA